MWYLLTLGSIIFGLLHCKKQKSKRKNEPKQTMKLHCLCKTLCINVQTRKGWCIWCFDKVTFDSENASVWCIYSVYALQKSLCIIDEHKSFIQEWGDFLKFSISLHCDDVCSHALSMPAVAHGMQCRGALICKPAPNNPTQSSSSLLFHWMAIKTGSECVIKAWLYTHSINASCGFHPHSFLKWVAFWVIIL